MTSILGISKVKYTQKNNLPKIQFKNERIFDMDIIKYIQNILK
jgi:hypothetical protein